MPAELLKIDVTKEQLTNGLVPSNYVLCETYYTSEGAKTKAGIIYGVNTDLIYADADNPDDHTSHAADMAEVSLIVTKLPQKLYFNPDDPNNSMPWETEMELQVGDVVWTDIMETSNAITLVCEGKMYKLLPYQDLYCAKREDKVIMLNGYILCEQVKKKAISELDVTSCDLIDPTKGIVAYLGNSNKRYLQEDYVDFEDLRVGDEVLLDAHSGIFLLERQLYSSKFSNEKLYWVVSWKKISMVLNRKA
jgi:hypothetical protein